MTTKPHLISLDELLDHIAIAEEEPSYEALARWCAHFPQHRTELTQHFVIWAEQVELPITQSIDAESFAASAVSKALNSLHKADQEAASAEVPASDEKAPSMTLVQVARSAGLSEAEVASRIGLDEIFVMKLLRCKIDFATIPQLCFERLHQALGVTLQRVLHHLRGPPIATVANARLRSRRKPVRTTETFAEALEASALPESLKAEWRNALAGMDPHAGQ